MSVRSEIANKVSELSRENLTLRNQLEEFEKSQDKRIDEIFCEFLTVLDTFERAEQTIKERELDKDETTKKAINRLLNAKKKALGVLEKFNVQKIEFENNKSIEELCEVADTEPDPGRETGDIVSIEKQGYTRQGHLIPYEVSRSIAACEGALLIVDASQGVQAQTISNLYMALEHDLEIIPVLNKCDMASAMPDEVEDEIIDLLGCKHEDIIRASGKTGMGVEEILKAVVERIPHPTGDEEAPLQALIFDSVFNSFRGIIAYFKIENGVIRKGDKVKFFNTGKEYDADEIGVLKMDMIPRAELRTGDVGYIISGIKTSREVKVGDTITHIARPCEKAIAGFDISVCSS